MSKLMVTRQVFDAATRALEQAQVHCRELLQRAEEASDEAEAAREELEGSERLRESQASRVAALERERDDERALRGEAEARIDELLREVGRWKRQERRLSAREDRCGRVERREARRRKLFQGRGDELRKLRHACALVKDTAWRRLDALETGTTEANELWAFFDLTRPEGRAR